MIHKILEQVQSDMMNLQSKSNAHRWVLNIPVSFVNATELCVVQSDCVCLCTCCVSTNFCILTFVITSSDRQWWTLALKLSFPFFWWRVMFLYAPLAHAQRYSTPSLASSRWHLGLSKTITPIPLAICCIIPASFNILKHFFITCCKLVLSSTVPRSSFLPVRA